MKKSEWSDNELEQLLRQMPKIKDHRDPRDIYQSLSIKVKKRKRPAWIVPTIASAAAVLLLFLMGPNIWQGIFQDSSSQQGEVAMDTENKNMQFSKAEPNNSGDTAINNEPQDNFSTFMVQPNETAIYEEDLENQEVLTYFVPDQNAQFLIPVSLIVSNGNESWLQKYETYSRNLTEVQWGLSDYYPLDATLREVNENTINIDVHEGHQYGNGSASEMLFLGVLEQILYSRDQLQKITLSTNGTPGIMFGNTGEKTEINKTSTDGKHSYYLFYPNNSNLPFLVPSVSVYTEIDKALESMLTDMQEYPDLKSPLSFKFIINSNASTNDQLVITIEDNEQLKNEPQYIYSIEAILLTAKEFGYKTVKFENTAITEIGRFNLKNEIKVPIAPNKVIIP